MTGFLPRVLGLALVPLALAGAVLAQEAPTGRLELLPPNPKVQHAGAREGVIAIWHRGDGYSEVLPTARALRLEGDALQLAGDHLLAGKGGETELVLAHAGQELRTKVAGAAAGTPPVPSFRNEVLPILTRHGCNSGGCHGAATGKEGFRLSLFGYDPGADHRRLTRELRGRRLNPDAPEASLVLEKATARVAHEGGQLFEPGHLDHEALRAWIAAGAPDDQAQAPDLTRLEIFPARITLAADGAPARFLVRATYADGATADVTARTLLAVDDSAVLDLNEDGIGTTGVPGEAHLLARFGGRATVAQIIVIDPKRPHPAAATVPSRGLVDEAIREKLALLRLAPAGEADDATFLRRLHLAVRNRLPELATTRAFLADTAKDKRERMVDEVLTDPAFSEALALDWSEVLRVEEERLEPKGMLQYAAHLQEAFQEGRPFDEMVRELLLAQGGNFTNPAANFWLVERDPKALAETTAQVLLGIRIQCAQCHDHPFERWRMDDYYGFTSFFAQMSSKQAEDPRERALYPNASGEVRHPVDQEPRAPRFLGGEAPEIARGADRREALAAWITSDDCPQFAENVANRLFERLFGRGLVTPVDDVRVSNPPSHPGLHHDLGARLRALHFDLKRLARELLLSATFAQAPGDPEVPDRHFAGAVTRRLSAEQLLDAIDQVTGVVTKHRGQPLGTSASALPGPGSTRFLEVFGRPRRESACTCERRGEPTLAQALHLINGETLRDKIGDKGGRLSLALEAGRSDRDLLEEFWLAALCRVPTAEEETALLTELAAAPDRREAWIDLVWALLNSRAFLFSR